MFYPLCLSLSEIWNHNQNLKDKGKKTDSQSSDRKKKPVSVSDILVKINRNTFNQVSIVIVAVKGTQGMCVYVRMNSSDPCVLRID